MAKIFFKFKMIFVPCRKAHIFLLSLDGKPQTITF